jgi:hypothetical protein
MHKYPIDEERLKDPTYSAYVSYRISDIPLKHIPADLESNFQALAEISNNYKKKLEEDFDYIYNENIKLIKKMDEKLGKSDETLPTQKRDSIIDILPSQRNKPRPPKKPKKKNSMVMPDKFNERLFEHFPFRAKNTGLNQMKKILESRNNE